MPSFQSYYAALFTQPLILQLIAVIQRDMQGALNLVTGSTYPAAGSLPTFLEYDLAIYPPENIPQLIVTPPRKLVMDADAEQTENSKGTLECLITLGNQDRNVLAINVQQYLRALSYVIDTQGSVSTPNNSGAPGRDMVDMYKTLTLSLPFWAPTTVTGLQTGSLKFLRVIAHDLGALYVGKFIPFLQTAALSVKIDLEEV